MNLNVQDWIFGSIYKTVELAGEGVGVVAGNFLVALASVPSGGASLVVTTVITVGTAAAGGYAFGYVAKGIEDGYDYLDSYARKKWGH